MWGNPFSEDSIGNVTIDSFRRLTDYSHRESVAQNNVGSALGIIRLEFTDVNSLTKPDRTGTHRGLAFSVFHTRVLKSDALPATALSQDGHANCDALILYCHQHVVHDCLARVATSSPGSVRVYDV